MFHLLSSCLFCQLIRDDQANLADAHHARAKVIQVLVLPPARGRHKAREVGGCAHAAHLMSCCCCSAWLFTNESFWLITALSNLEVEGLFEEKRSRGEREAGA